jgi:hypothetical protein
MIYFPPGPRACGSPVRFHVLSHFPLLFTVLLSEVRGNREGHYVYTHMLTRIHNGLQLSLEYYGFSKPQSVIEIYELSVSTQMITPWM